MKKYYVPKWVNSVINLINTFLSLSSQSVCELTDFSEI